MALETYPLSEYGPDYITVRWSRFPCPRKIEITAAGEKLPTISRLIHGKTGFPMSNGELIEVERKLLGLDVFVNGVLLPNSVSHPNRIFKPAGILAGFNAATCLLLGLWVFLRGALAAALGVFFFGILLSAVSYAIYARRSTAYLKAFTAFWFVGLVFQLITQPAIFASSAAVMVTAFCVYLLLRPFFSHSKAKEDKGLVEERLWEVPPSRELLPLRRQPSDRLELSTDIRYALENGTL